MPPIIAWMIQQGGLSKIYSDASLIGVLPRSTISLDLARRKDTQWQNISSKTFHFGSIDAISSGLTTNYNNLLNEWERKRIAVPGWRARLLVFFGAHLSAWAPKADGFREASSLSV